MGGAAKMRASDSRAGTKHQRISRLRCSAVGRPSLSWQGSIFMAGGAPWRMMDSHEKRDLSQCMVTLHNESGILSILS
jgi:hypothetical protein